MIRFLTILIWLPVCLTAQTLTFNQVSDPLGVINESGNFNSGSQVSTIAAPAEDNGLRLTHWTVNGTEYRHSLGTPLNPASFTILENTTATAHYKPEQEDLDLDGVADWFEVFYFGNTSNGATHDGDSDGLDLREEFLRGHSPLLQDQTDSGGVAETQSSSLLIINDPGKSSYHEVSIPGGILEVHEALDKGTIRNSTIPPDNLEGLRFTHWSGNGFNPYDFLGRARRQVAVTVTNDTNLHANFLLQQEDADLDQVPDWFETRFHQGIQFTATHDADGDGLGLGEEYVRGFHPLLKDTLLPGGVAETQSARVQVSLSFLIPFTISSDPAGILSDQGQVASNTLVNTPLAPADVNGLRFGYWSVNGVRATRSNGQSIEQTRQVLTEETLFIAHYFPAQDDTDGDEVPDWFEWRAYGNLDQSAASDTDQDGYSLAAEHTQGSTPVLHDDLRPGGVVEIQSQRTIIDLQFFPRERRVLEDGIVQHIWSENPFTPDGVQFNGPTHPGLGDWDGDQDLDLFVRLDDNSLRVWENLGSRFSLDLHEQSTAFSAMLSDGGFAIGDWSQDGRSDLVFASPTANQFKFKQSSGTFTSQTGSYDFILTPIGVPIGAAIGDLDANGSPDLVGLFADGTVQQYLHTGNNTAPYTNAGATQNILGSPVPNAQDISVGDVNFDGQIDILISDVFGRVWQFNNLGAASFELRSRVWGGTGEGFADGLSLAIGDLDGDGDTDAIAGFAQGGLMFLRDPKMARPLNLQAFGAQDSVRLEWLPAYQSRIKGYHVYRSIHPNTTFDRVNTILVDTPNYLNMNLTTAAVYDYFVTAVSEFLFPGNSLPRPVESPASDIASALAGSTALGIADVCGAPGGEAVVQINVGHIGGVVGEGLQIRLAYDPLKLTPITQVNGARLTSLKSPLTANLNISDNSATANGELIISASGSDPIFGSGHLFDVVFQVSPSAQGGQTSNLSFNQATLRSSTGVSLPVDFSDTGTLHIEAAFVRGDINADGLLDARDLTLLMQLAASLRPATPFELMAADLSGNDRIDPLDAQLLVRLLQGLKLNP